MLKWNEAPSEVSNEDVRFERNRRQDDDFCRALRAALYARKEFDVVLGDFRWIMD